jgi:hypothetical protein
MLQEVKKPAGKLDIDRDTFALVFEVASVIDVLTLSELLTFVNDRSIFTDGRFSRALENVSETFSSCDGVGREL